MISLDEACRIAFEKRDRFDAVFELGIDRAFDRNTYWTIAFDYVDQDSYDSPFALCPTGRGLCICLDKETGKEVNGEDFLVEDYISGNIPGHRVSVPNEYYRVPWYTET